MASSNGDVEPGASIRVLMANLPEAMSQAIGHALTQQPDIVLSGQVDGNIQLLAAAADNVDVIILGAHQVRPPPGICSHLLSEYPHLKILVLETSGNDGVIYSLGLRHYALPKVSIDGLLNDVRRAYAWDIMA